MKRILKVFWNDLHRLIFRIHLPIGITILFFIVAANYWEDYAHVTTFIFLIVAFIISDKIFKRKR
ncbi:hypothetical protein B1H58_09215 [Pantoea alhagi]|uniref:Uncharacterized protein n=1 Tax=Pantoea alhagi TaxID=1891675 RepID=A0A1W6B521_9GAMM|nr:hypothetical protein B1H58_09215 [Pantoea alhagi]